MKVLFVSACGLNGEPKTIVKNQGYSLTESGIDVVYFCIGGRGLKGYLKSFTGLKVKIRNERPDLVHAHYVLTGLLALLAGGRPLVVSFMGSEPKASFFLRLSSRILANCFADCAILKSLQMKDDLKLKRAVVIPNGVNLHLFREQDRVACCIRTGMDPGKKNVLFASDPLRKEKNFNLAHKVFRNLDQEEFRLVQVSSLSQDELCLYYNGADVLLLTSLWEGSPNVVKEAMACNLPVVSTDVGDVRLLLEGVRKSRVCSFNPEEIADAIVEVTADRERSDGRAKIIKMGLDSESVALRLTEQYGKITNIR